MEVFRISLLGLPHNMRRVLPLLFSIVLSVFCIQLSSGYIIATFQGLKFSVIYGGTGHLQIADENQFGAYAETALQHGLDQERQQSVLKVLQETSEITRVSRQAGVQGLVSSGERTIPFQGLGVDENYETVFLRLISPVIDGRSLDQAFDVENRALLGQTMATQLEVDVDDFVTLLSSTEDGGLNVLDVDAVGKFTTGIPAQDALFLQLPLEKAQELAQSEKISKFVVYLGENDDVDSIQRELQSKMPPSVRVASWLELSDFYTQLKSNFEVQFWIFSCIIYLVSFLAIMNASSTAVLERTFQIGVFQALGFTSFQTRLVFFYEVFLVVSFGCLTGLALAFMTIEFVTRASIMLPPPPGRTTEVPLSIAWDTSSAAMICVTLFVICLLALFASSRRVFKMPIIEAIKRG